MSEPSLDPMYRLICPYCNGHLYPNAFTPESAPWVCVICNHSWWAAELSAASRARFRPALCDFGVGPGLLELQDAVLQERDEARTRGTSVRFDQVQSLPLYVLHRLPQRDDDFGALVKREITRKGG